MSSGEIGLWFPKGLGRRSPIYRKHAEKRQLEEYFAAFEAETFNIAKDSCRLLINAPGVLFADRLAWIKRLLDCENYKEIRALEKEICTHREAEGDAALAAAVMKREFIPNDTPRPWWNFW